VLPTDPYYEYAGLMTSTEGTMSGSHFYTTFDWQKSGWDVSIGNTYISPGDDMGTGGSTGSKRIRIPSYVSWDLAVGYTLHFQQAKLSALLKEVKVSIGLNNLADKMPPSAPQAFPTTSAAGADVATYGAIGRLYYVSAALKF
jgi:iron complex outermembrane receptor protein